MAHDCAQPITSLSKAVAAHESRINADHLRCMIVLIVRIQRVRKSNALPIDLGLHRSLSQCWNVTARCALVNQSGPGTGFVSRFIRSRRTKLSLLMAWRGMRQDQTYPSGVQQKHVCMYARAVKGVDGEQSYVSCCRARSTKKEMPPLESSRQIIIQGRIWLYE